MWTYQPQNSDRTNTLLFTCNPPSPPKTSYLEFTNVLCNRFTCLKVWSIDSPGVYTDETIVGVSINKSDLPNDKLSVEGFTTWLSQNPTTVYYELATPIEEYLENVYDKESIKTYQLDAPLRSLPNGVKDEIKDGVLIRRCGEVIFDGSEDEAWAENTGGATTTKRYILSNSIHTHHMKGSNNSFICDKLISSVWSESIPIGITVGENKVFVYNKDKLTLGAFKEWLQANPIKLVYELNAPIEMKLSEVKPQSANFSFQRQFTEGKWLRELPNGVKDTIENGKVVRRTTKIVLTGNEAGWATHSNNTHVGGTLYRYYLPMNSLVPIGYKQNNLLCNNLKVVHDRPGEMWTCENIHYRIDYKQAGIYIVKDNITTLDNFKSWLKSNPVTIITKAASSTVEELSSNNCMYYPYHDINTCCGSMYIGDGRNYILNDNKMMTENPVIIETEFREIKSKTVIGESKYKKCNDGYDTPYISSSSKNLLDISIDNILNGNLYGFEYTKLENGFRVSNTITSSYSSIRYRVYLKAGVKYRINYDIEGPYAFVDLKTLVLGYICNLGRNTIFSVKDTGYHSINFYCTGSTATTSTATFTNIIISEGEASVPFEPYNKTTKYFENMGENDVDDLRHQVSLTGFNYDKMLNESFDMLLRGML